MSARRFTIGALGACLALAACASGARYEGRTSEGVGYSEVRIDDRHWLVQYAGELSDTRDIVERDLLFRSAELTLQSGYNWFSPSDHAADVEVVVYAEAPSPSASSRTPHLQDEAGRHDASSPVPPPPSYDRYVSHQIITMGLGKGPPDSFHAASVWVLLSPVVHGAQAQPNGNP